MKIAIMQPYFFPYLGYWQLINISDIFVIYDDVNFIKGGWVNRNKILINDKPSFFTIPVKKFHYKDKINEIYISPSVMWKSKMIRMFEFKYRKAPFFDEIFPIVQNIILFNTDNLSHLLVNSIKIVASYLEIKSNIKISSSDFLKSQLQGEARLIDICKKENATVYINAEGGRSLYKQSEFNKNGIELQFLSYKSAQKNCSGQSHLSIIDLLMFNSRKIISDMMRNDCILNSYD
jgi:hypothetical protein